MTEGHDRIPLFRRRWVRVVWVTGLVVSAAIVLMGVLGPLFKSAPVQSVSQSRPGPAGTDERGFVNSLVRCEGDQTVVVLGRTKESAVAICRTDDGQLVYKGVRLSGGPTLVADEVKVTADGFEARHDTDMYALSPEELVITADGAVWKREPMVDFQDRR